MYLFWINSRKVLDNIIKTSFPRKTCKNIKWCKLRFLSVFFFYQKPEKQFFAKKAKRHKTRQKQRYRKDGGLGLNTRSELAASTSKACIDTDLLIDIEPD